jgi:hypothetical protein
MRKYLVCVYQQGRGNEELKVGRLTSLLISLRDAFESTILNFGCQIGI